MSIVKIYSKTVRLHCVCCDVSIPYDLSSKPRPNPCTCDFDPAGIGEGFISHCKTHNKDGVEGQVFEAL